MNMLEESAREMDIGLQSREEESQALAALNRSITREHSKNIQVVVKMILQMTKVMILDKCI